MPLDIFPFIVSCGRSGSTLLRSMIDAHPDLAVPGESHFIIKLLPRSSSYHTDTFDAARFVEDVMQVSWTKRQEEPTWVDQWGIPREYLRRAVIEAAPGSYPEGIRAVFGGYATWRGKARYGDKTPSYISHIGKIGNLLPEARFIHLVRDGRNVALAYVSAPFGASSLEEAALHWRARVLAGREAGKQLGPNRYLELKYEDLVQEPEKYLRVICEWLHLSFDPVMLDHRESLRGLKISNALRGAHRNVLLPIQKGMRHWASQMDRSEVECFELLAGDALEAFNYDIAVPQPRKRSRLVVSIRRAFLEGKKLTRRARNLESANWW